MYTEATQQALQGLRDLSSIQWYIIPLLGIILYIYVTEVKKAKQNGNWNAIFAGLTLFGMVLFNETWNGWVLHFSQRSAVWTAPGPTSLEPWWVRILRSGLCSQSPESFGTMPLKKIAK